MKKITRKELTRILDEYYACQYGKYGNTRLTLKNLDLSGLNLNYVSFHGITLDNVDFSNANLTGTTFYGSILRNVDFTNAIIDYIELKPLYLINVKGLPTQKEMLDKLFEKTDKGYIVYKTFGTYYGVPRYWEIEENSIITENVDIDRKNDCSYGINVATLDWIKRQTNHINQPIWECLLSFGDLDKVCVPYGTDGKIRCGRLKLLERLPKGE